MYYPYYVYATSPPPQKPFLHERIISPHYSNIPGWKRAGPDGAMVSPGAPGTSARLVRLLLEPAANKAKSSIVGEKR